MFGMGFSSTMPPVLKPSDEEAQVISEKLAKLQQGLKEDERSSSSSNKMISPYSNSKSTPPLFHNDINSRKGSPSISPRPIAQLRKRYQSPPPPPELTLQTLPSFAASPKPSPTLTIQHFNLDILPVEKPTLTIQHFNIDIPPEEKPTAPVLELQVQVETADQEPESESESESESEEVEEIQDATVVKANLAQCFTFSTVHNELEHLQHITRIFYRIEQTIPDIQQWYQLKSLNLSRQNITSLNNLKNCLPMLETLQM
jgi:hypothetical protein